MLLHEWDYDRREKPRTQQDELGRIRYDRQEPYTNLITWVYDGNSYTPVAKLTEEDSYTIVQDYLGTPIQALDSKGEVVWDCVLDIYGEVFRLKGKRDFIPFRFQGQYEDQETGLYYNRFRYYSPETGSYISQDPIGLAGNNPNFYAYVFDSNTQVDVFGLDCFKAKKSNFSGVKEASRILKELGLPRTVRKNILESFDRRTIKVRTAKKNEFGIRYYDNIDAFANGRYVFETFPASRNSLALLPEWNRMTYFKQWKIKEGTLLFEGIAAPQKYLQGGQIQKFIVDNPKISLI